MRKKNYMEDDDEKTMESRKIQVSAGGSFFIVLPKEWSKSIGLRKGERVDVFLEEDGSVRIVPAEITRERVKTATLHVDEKVTPKALDLFIKANYMAGCSIINIESKERLNSELKKAVKASVAELIGVETAEETSDRLSLRAIVDPTGFPLQNLIKRVYSLSTSMFVDARKALSGGDAELADDVVDRAKEAMKLYRLMVRQLMLAHADRTTAKNLGIENSTECIILAVMARDVSRLIYHISSMAKYVKGVLEAGFQFNGKLADLMSKIFDLTQKMIEDAFRAFMERDAELANEVMGNMDRIRELDEIITTEIFETVKDVREAIRLTSILREVRRVAGYTVAVADDTVFNETIRFSSRPA
ncbi:MAG: hypothetical protein DRO36_04130 [Candidatus Hecatellales archaeon]|nr:MAG: hypothetical protein DRO36_04130 [Candidatus Hecatellales archaeon]